MASADFYSIFVMPFTHYQFMAAALLACCLLCLSASPIGSLIVLRRLSLVGDTLSHAILPGVAIAFVLFGFSLLAMSIGAIITGLLIAVLSGLVARNTRLKEDASFASFYLLSLALGTCIISAFGTNGDLLHFLFGNLLSIPDHYLQWLVGCVVLSCGLMTVFYRQFVAEAFDPHFMRINNLHGNMWYFLFLALFVINLVVAFFALGTLLALAMFVLPVIIARLWVTSLPRLMLMSIAIGMIASYLGLVMSFHWNLPSGPAIVLCMGILYALSLIALLIQKNYVHFRFSS